MLRSLLKLTVLSWGVLLSKHPVHDNLDLDNQIGHLSGFVKH